MRSPKITSAADEVVQYGIGSARSKNGASISMGFLRYFEVSVIVDLQVHYASAPRAGCWSFSIGRSATTGQSVCLIAADSAVMARKPAAQGETRCASEESFLQPESSRPNSLNCAKAV